MKGYASIRKWSNRYGQEYKIHEIHGQFLEKIIKTVDESTTQKYLYSRTKQPTYSLLVSQTTKIWQQTTYHIHTKKHLKLQWTT